MSKNMGKTKNSTDDMIDNAVNQQQDWHSKRRLFAGKFFRKLNVFAKRNPEKRVIGKPAVKSKSRQKLDNRSVIREYWLPILCAFIVVFVTIFVLINRIQSYQTHTAPVPEPIVRTVPTQSK